MSRIVSEFNHLGFDCMVRAMPGWLNGYVRIPENHPWSGRDFQDLRVYAHWGLSFGGTFEDTPGTYWIGFDTMHAYDLLSIEHVEDYNIQEFELAERTIRDMAKIRQAMSKFSVDAEEWTNKGLDFCIDQCKAIASQAQAALIQNVPLPTIS